MARRPTTRPGRRLHEFTTGMHPANRAGILNAARSNTLEDLATATNMTDRRNLTRLLRDINHLLVQP